jgi:hypothetical protein
MGVTVMVRCATQGDCQREVDWLCRMRGAVQMMPPTERLGDGWVARVVMPKAPADGEGLVGR